MFLFNKSRRHVKKQRLHLADKSPYSQSYSFSSSHVQVWELDHKEGWAPKNWCFQIVVLEKTLDSPLDWKEIKPVKPKGNQFWIFFGRTAVNTLATWCKVLTYWKRLWCWERLRAKEKKGQMVTFSKRTLTVHYTFQFCCSQSPCPFSTEQNITSGKFFLGDTDDTLYMQQTVPTDSWFAKEI